MTNDKITVSRELLRQTIDLLDDMLAPGATFSTASLRAAVEQPVQEPVNIDQIASERYKVVPTHESMFYRWAVVAGDGSQQLYIGREVDCQNMARKFAGAFLDGAYLAASQPAPVQEPARRRIAIEECLFVLRPSVKGKFPQEQALEELAGFTAQPRKVVKLSEAEVRSLAKQCDEGGEDNEYLLALSNAIQDAFIAKNRWAE